MIHFADKLTRACATIRDFDLTQLKTHFNEEQIVELTLVVCVANFTNRVNDGLLSSPDLGD
ncbi:MAG: hypothetical protein NVS1B11_23130 [Terriglobales bacterium]